MLGEEKDPKWMQNLWRPMMGWMYMLICLLDMAIFPILWSLLQAMMHQPISQWNPLTLQGAGLFHIAMGAVLGIAAFGRTQEKLAGTAANPTANTQNLNMTGNTSGGYGSNQGSFGGAPSFGGSSNSGYGGNNFSSGGAPAFGAPSTGNFGGGFNSPAPAAGGFSGGGFGSASSATPSVGKFGKVVPQADQPAL
jgi:hypothetical protein